MKRLALFLGLLLAPAFGWAAYAANTLALYDFEQNLSDTAGTRHGSPVGAVSYGTTGVWHGTYTLAGGYATIPATAISVTGTCEFSGRTAASPANSVIVLGGANAGQRALEIYQFGGQFYAYDAATGTNAPFLSISGSSNYYIKQTWNASRRIIWAGTWTTAGTATLTRVTNVAQTYLGSVTAYALRASGSIGLPWDGAMDWVRFRDVFDDTATITTDPTGGGNPIFQTLGLFQTNGLLPVGTTWRVQ